MITRLEVSGFKSLRDFAIDFEPLTVLIGANGVGKSNVLEALGLLSRLATMPIADAFRLGRGKAIDQFGRSDGESVRVMRLAAEFFVAGRYPEAVEGVPPFQSRWRYELVIERQLQPTGVERLEVVSERLDTQADARWIEAHASLAPFVRGGEAEVRVLAAVQGFTAMGRGSGVPWVVRRELEDLRTLDLSVGVTAGISERIDAGALARDGSNLPSVLLTLSPTELAAIRADLASLVPGVASFDVEAVDDEVRLAIEYVGEGRVPARLVSAGTLRVLTLLSALHMSLPRPSVFCVEEPENGIYPGRLRALLEVMMRATTRTHEDELQRVWEAVQRKPPHVTEPFIETNVLPTQVIVTTHSPVVLAAMRAQPGHLRLLDTVRRREGRVTRVRGVSAVATRDRSMVSLKEIDALLHAAQAEDVA